MIRLFYIDSLGHVHERTLHFFLTDDPKCSVSSVSAILSDASVMRRREVLSSFNCSTTCGSVTDEWFGCMLRTADFMACVRGQSVIASALVYALEHWRLHFQIHSHICSGNISLWLIRHDVISHCVWNFYCKAAPKVTPRAI